MTDRSNVDWSVALTQDAARAILAAALGARLGPWGAAPGGGRGWERRGRGAAPGSPGLGSLSSSGLRNRSASLAGASC
jgi:hypothetical protein